MESIQESYSGLEKANIQPKSILPEVYTLRQRHSELLKTIREDYRVNFFREIAKSDTITKVFPKNNTSPSVIFPGDFTIKDELETLENLRYRITFLERTIETLDAVLEHFNAKSGIACSFSEKTLGSDLGVNIADGDGTITHYGRFVQEVDGQLRANAVFEILKDLSLYNADIPKLLAQMV